MRRARGDVVAVAGVGSVNLSRGKPVADLLHPDRFRVQDRHIVGVKTWLTAHHYGRSKEYGRYLTACVFKKELFASCDPFVAAHANKTWPDRTRIASVPALKAFLSDERVRAHDGEARAQRGERESAQRRPIHAVSSTSVAY